MYKLVVNQTKTLLSNLANYDKVYRTDEDADATSNIIILSPDYTKMCVSTTSALGYQDVTFTREEIPMLDGVLLFKDDFVAGELGISGVKTLIGGNKVELKDSSIISGLVFAVRGEYLNVWVLSGVSTTVKRTGEWVDFFHHVYEEVYSFNSKESITEHPTASTKLLAFTKAIFHHMDEKRSNAKESSLVTGSKIKKVKGKRKKVPVTTEYRLISLLRPDYAEYEYYAHKGRGVKQHWVRGHWRKQPYKSTGEIRTIWIDGYIKGDASLGVVEGQKIYTA